MGFFVQYERGLAEVAMSELLWPILYCFLYYHYVVYHRNKQINTNIKMSSAHGFPFSIPAHRVQGHWLMYLTCMLLDVIC